MCVYKNIYIFCYYLSCESAHVGVHHGVHTEIRELAGVGSLSTETLKLGG